jgi:ribosomal protein S18 acetylase RimI-like enzyme
VQAQPLLWLDVLQSNVAARRFYERRGFRLTGSDLLRVAGRELPMWVMRRPLELPAPDPGTR